MRRLQAPISRTPPSPHVEMCRCRAPGSNTGLCLSGMDTVFNNQHSWDDAMPPPKLQTWKDGRQSVASPRVQNRRDLEQSWLSDEARRIASPPSCDLVVDNKPTTNCRNMMSECCKFPVLESLAQLSPAQRPSDRSSPPRPWRESPNAGGQVVVGGVGAQC